MLAFRNYKANNIIKNDIVANRTKASRKFFRSLNQVALSAHTKT